jgi:thiol-disulfide isomerase/thioredoxin
VLVVVVLLATALGTWRLVRDGRFRRTRTRTTESARLSPMAEVGLGLGERATLLQFSSAFCAPCRTTRRVLDEVATVVPGVVHVEIDAEAHLDLVRLLHVARTPTTLVLDARGVEMSRASGAPTRDAVLSTLGRVLEA